MPFGASMQPRPSDALCSEERVAKAARNYAMEYCRNGLRELAGILGRDRAAALGGRSDRLTGLQQYARMAAVLGCRDGDAAEAARFLALAFEGMGDATEPGPAASPGAAEVRPSGRSIVRGLEGEAPDDAPSRWTELWRGTVASQRAFMDLVVEPDEDVLIWPATPRPPF